MSWYTEKTIIQYTTCWDKPRLATYWKVPTASVLAQLFQDKGIYTRAQLYFIHSISVGEF
jgi:hypothetical protein